MQWNTNVNIAFGFILGVVCATSYIAITQTADAKLDLDTLGKIATVIVVPLTLGLVAFTAVLARETRRMWVQNREPPVLVTIEPQEHRIQWMELVVENVGMGTAFDIVATLSPDIERHGHSPHNIKVSQSSLLRLPVLKPGQRFSTFVGEWMNLEPKKTTFKCKCKDSVGRVHMSTHDVDLSSYATLLSDGDTALEKIATELKKIHGAISGRLEVNTHDAEARAKEEGGQEATSEISSSGTVARVCRK